MYAWTSPEKERGKRKEGEYVGVHMGVLGVGEVGQLLFKCFSHSNSIMTFREQKGGKAKLNFSFQIQPVF